MATGGTLIVYATKYGCTEKCALALKERLPGEVDLVNLKKVRNVDPESYGKIIIGGSIYMGGIQKEVRRFCADRLETLRGKRLGLFICCMQEGETAETELAQSFPPELMGLAAAKDYFGGKFDFGRMGPIDRFIVRKVSKVDCNTSTVSEEKLDRFAQAMGRV